MADKNLVCKDCGAEFVSQKVNKHFTKKKDSQMNHKDVQLVEKLEKNKEEITISNKKDTSQKNFEMYLFYLSL